MSASLYAGTDGNLIICANDPEMLLFSQLGGSPDPGGTWTDPNGASFNGLLDPSAAVPGQYSYTVSPAAPCPADQAFVDVQIIPLPDADIISTFSEGCAPVQALFVPTYTGPGTFTWDMGNGTTFVGMFPDTVTYALPGSYDVTLMIDVGNGCGADTSTYIGLVQVFLPPQASFLQVPGQINTVDPTVVFQNTSIGAGSYFWQFGELGSSTDQSPIFTFPDALDAEYDVCLTAFASPSCFDTMCTTITVEPGLEVFVPNTFTPDGNGVNDVFYPVVSGVDAEFYAFDIFDRWGRSLFSTDRPGVGWEGTYPDGKDVPQGVFVWKLVARDPYSGARIERIGHVTLLR